MIRQEARAIVVIRKKFRRLSARMLLSARLWMILPEPAVNNDTIANASYSMILPSSIRTMRSARRAISLLWVIITIVCLNFSPVSFKSLSTSALLLLSRFPVGRVKLVQHRNPRKACCPPGSFLFLSVLAVLAAQFYFFALFTNHCAIRQSSVFSEHFTETL